MGEQLHFQRWRVAAEVLSPLHIGAGGPPLLADYDFVAERGRVWVLDPQRALAGLSDEELAAGVDMRLSRLLRPSQYAACARYVLPLRGEAPNQILPLVRDVHDRPYLPGSSLKGALRTALAWALIYYLAPPFQSQRDVAAGPPERAARPLERRLFGPDPNRDLLRALRVRDAQPVGDAAVEATLLGLYGRRGRDLTRIAEGTRWCVETLAVGARFEGELLVDRGLLAQGQLPAPRIDDTPLDLADTWYYAREFAKALVQHEQEFYCSGGLPRIESFYATLAAKLESAEWGETALPLGWGTGWFAKTVGLYLQGEDDFDRLVQRLGLARGGRPEEFPASRRLVERGGVAEAPPGWIWLRLEPR
ncbi:MAG: type III-A CRISPR-associated RAMP protein Csm5 [Chloroflexi bacterium]|nr:type III-A CRISPR-associated RAMP protein Csm5 [Chloroflexota bacterium]